jgi:glycosyltransferase involved in cell wall biosynthesis
MPHYRIDFFSGLRNSLAKENILLKLIYGKNRYVPRMDEFDLPWANPINNYVFKVGKQEFYWQKIPRRVFSSDLIVLMQESKILSNYQIIIRSLLVGKKVALWGHGIDYQKKQNIVRSQFKKIYSTKISWWFAYTKGVANLIRGMGFPAERITIVENAIDTKLIIAESANIPKENIVSLKEEVGIRTGPIGLFCGGMIKEKRLDFLLDACRKIKSRVSAFEMIFIGEGPESYKIRSFVLDNSWAHFVGPKFGLDKIPYFKMADIFLMPGMVGLAILDSFAFRVPMITTNQSTHSPEIEYLINYDNGVMTDNSLDSFVEASISVMFSKELKERLMQGCVRGAERYTLENMIRNFSDGILKAISI